MLSRGMFGISFLWCAVTVDAMQLEAAGRPKYKCSSNSPAPKLTIVSVVAELPEEYVDALRTNRMLEADAYGYEYCEFQSRQNATRHPNWEKVKALQIMFPKRDRLVWMDADAYFTKAKPFESISYNGELVFSKLGELDIIWTDDLFTDGRDCNVNTGVMAMTNSSWTQELWRGTWNWGKAAADEWRFHDQLALCHWTRRHKEEFANHTLTIPHDLMNSVGKNWSEEFIAHPAGGIIRWGGTDGKYESIQPNVKSANSGWPQRSMSDVTLDILPLLKEANKAMAVG